MKFCRSILTLSLSFDCHFNFRLVLGNVVRRQNAAPKNIGINHRAAAHDAAGIQHRVAANLSAVPQQRAEFSQACIKGFAFFFHSNVAWEQFKIGNLDARAQVRLVTKN